MITITETNVDEFIVRSSVYTTGGGLDVQSQLTNVESFRKELHVQILEPSEMSNDACVCSVTEIGGLGAPPLPKKYTIPLMVKELEKVSGKKIAGFFPPEIGQESIVLESAHYACLPVVDFDPVGFRAVPFVDISVFLMENAQKPFTPAVVLTDRGEIISIPKEYSYQKAEEKLRKMTELSKFGCILVLGEITPIKEIQKLTKNQKHSYHSIMHKSSHKLQSRLQLECTVTSVVEFAYTGFDCKVIKLNNGFTLCVLNEAILLLDKHNSIIASVPERILVLNREESQGISTDSLKKDSTFILRVIPPEPIWNSKRGQALFGRERFSFFKQFLTK